MVIWRLLDGKPGHEKQSMGLAQALSRHVAVKIHDIRVGPCLQYISDWILGRFPAGIDLPTPDILIAAGHRTHLALLAARRARGGRAVVLMQPSLPLWLFNLCLIPEHDTPPHRANVITTRGALNIARPSRQHDADLGLILIGGESAHFDWNNLHVIDQIREITQKIPAVHWRLTTSRRTPADFLPALEQAGLPNLEILPHETTPAGWLEAELARTGQAWVTEDSVSMVYEALTAGCAVGLLDIQKKQDSRVASGIEQLIRERWLTPFDAWQPNQPLVAGPEGFDEADRCARKILEKWFNPAP